MTSKVASCFIPQLLFSGLDALNLKLVESNLIRAGSGCLMPALWAPAWAANDRADP